MATPVLAEVPKNAPPQKDTLQAVLDRIHVHAATDAWQKEGWKDDAIEAYLDKLVATIAAATEIKELKLPVRLSEVRPPDPAQRIPFRQEGQLLIGTDLKLRSLRRSIVLADGCVELQSIPEDSVIVARHAIVGASITRRCVIVAGSLFSTQFDGEPGNPDAGSVIVSRGAVRIQSSYGSIIAAPDIRTESCQSSIFLNSEVVGRDRGGSRSVRVPGFALDPQPVHPLAAKIEVLGIVTTPPPPPAVGPGGLPPFAPRRGGNLEATGVVFRFGDKRHVANVREPIVDDAGNPVAALSGWELAFVSESVAVFRNGEADALVRLEGR